MAKFIKIFLIILCMILQENQCNGVNILVILPTAVRSHYTYFKFLITTLATEHNITFIGNYPFGETHPNITTFETKSSYRNCDRSELFRNILDAGDPATQMYIIYEKFGKDSVNLYLTENDIINKIGTTKYSLFITINLNTEAILKIAPMLNIPFIQIVTAMNAPWTNTALRNQNNFAYDLSLITDGEDANSFYNRLMKFLKTGALWLYYNYDFLPRMEIEANKFFPPNLPSLTEILHNNINFILVNQISEMGHARANNPNVVEIGCLHCKSSQKLPKDLEDFMSNAQHGVIYFSLGTTVPDIFFSKDVIQCILNVFKKLPQQILWKLDSKIEDLPPNVKIAKWLPQQDILGHKNTKLFIMQGGMLSLQESAYHGVPVLVIPLAFDQYSNAYAAKQKEYGRVISIKHFNEHEFYENIQELLSNPKYSKNIRKISEAMIDRPINVHDKLRFWVNYVLKHKDPKLLRPVYEDLSTFELMQFDILLFLVLLAFIICLLLIFIFIKLIKYIITLFNILSNNKIKKA